MYAKRFAFVALVVSCLGIVVAYFPIIGDHGNNMFSQEYIAESNNASLQRPLDTKGESRTPVPSPSHSKCSCSSIDDGTCSTVTFFESLPHPSCLAEAWMRGNASYSPFHKFSHWNCYKHGGHYKPGYNRMNGTYLKLSNILVRNGKFYSAAVRAQEKKVSYQYSGHFAMISGNWPQIVTTSITLHSLETYRADVAKDTSGAVSSDVCVETGYVMPPTDFISTYHVIVEVVLTMFHRVLSFALSKQPVFVFTSKPQSRYGFKAQSCHFNRDACLDTPWGQMFSAAVGGQKNIIFGEEEPHRRKNAPLDYDSRTFIVKELLVGNPTHCEPLWGPDAFFVQRALPHSAVGGGYHDCQNLLWKFHCFYIAQQLSVEAESIAPITSTSGVDIVFSSRKGDWAREIENEPEVFDVIKRHVENKYKGKARLVKFTGKLADQMRQVLTATIFICNHGAGIIPSVYMPPNSGVITLSLDALGFYPFSVFPSWQHWRNLIISQTCNRKLWNGKCKWSSLNNNNNIVKRDELAAILSAIDSIVDDQQRHPKEKPLT